MTERTICCVIERNALDQPSELLDRAMVAFDTGNIEECVSILKSLALHRPFDVQILHNFAVAEFYASDLREIVVFGNKINMIFNMSNVNLTETEMLLDPTYYLLYYNMAVLCYHTTQYGDVVNILNKLYKYIETIDRDTAEKIVLLLIETYLAICRPQKALNIILSIEIPPYLSELKESAVGTSYDNSGSMSGIQYKCNEMSWFQARLLELKCRCYICFSKYSEKDLRIFDANCEKAVEQVGFESEKCYKARCKNKKYTSKILTARFQYMRGAFKDCIQTLVSIPFENNFEDTFDSIPMIIYNNLGCAHFYLKKPTLAALYFQKSMEEHKNNMKLLTDADSSHQGKPLYALGNSNMAIHLYNMGVALLHSGKPLEAFDCLTEVVQVYHMNPRVWLRLAECCILVHKPGNERDFDCTKRKDLLQAVVGSGHHRKLVLNLRLFENNKYSYDAQSFAIPVASLEFATLCLRNTLLLLSNENVDYAPCSIIKVQKQNDILKVAALTSSAYVALCIGDPLVCLTHTRAIFNLTTSCPGIYKLLAHLYSAEAYLMLNKFHEAVEHLRPDYCNYLNSTEDNDILWNPIRPYKPDNPTSMRASILYNLAVVYAMKGCLSKATEILKQVWLIKAAPRCEVPVQLISLTIYIELASGRIDGARNLIKQHCPQYSVAKQQKITE